jgi:hypothetical protein
MYICNCNAIVKLGFLLVAVMTKAIPCSENEPRTLDEVKLKGIEPTLTATLRIESPSIIIDYSRSLLIHMLMKDLTTEEGNVTLGIKRPIQ